MAGSAGESIVTDGLVLCLDAANAKSYPGSGTSVKDLAQNFIGSLVNGVVYLNGAFVFDGTNDIITIPITSSIRNLTQNYSFCCFVTTSLTGGQYGIFVKGNTDWGVYLRTAAEGLQFSHLGYNAAGTSSQATVTPAGAIQINTWYFICYTYDGNFVIGYVNGKEVVKRALSSFVFKDAGNDATIGKMSVALPQYLKGNVSQVLLYNRALSTSEIQQNFDATRSRYGL